jgi:hypothetical protein
LDLSAMRRAEEWIERHRKFWEASLDRLAAYVEAADEAVPGPPSIGAEE